MSYIPLKIKAGCSVEQTPLLLEANGFSQTLNIRFFQGLLQQLGFFQRYSSATPRGVCRGLFPWADTSGNQYIALGATEELAVFNNGNLYDITPQIATSNLTTPYTTTLDSTTVTITDSSGQAVQGNFVLVNTYSSVANLLIQGVYQIQTVGSGNFTITVPTQANTGTTGGVTSLFTTTNTQSSVQVTLNNHGFTANTSVYVVYVSTTVGGITLYGEYVVQTVIDANNFTINAGGAATSSTTGYENSDQVQLIYLLGNGSQNAGGTAGYGTSPYGQSPYGGGIIESYLPLRQWFFGGWGSDLIASYTNGPIYLWVPGGFYPPNIIINNPATVITNAPSFNTAIFIAIAEQQIISVGSEVLSNGSHTGMQDPLLISWCDVDDYTDWTATTTNQAGSFRIPVGSRIVGGFSVSLQNFIFTDLGLWAMQYVGLPYVYSVTQIGWGCGLIAARAVTTLANAVIWMSQKGFFMYSGGSVTPIPCPIWDIIFNNLDYEQQDKITCAPNSAFNEISWHLPSASGSGENDTVVKLNLIDGSWDYSNGTNAQIYVRTAAYDQSIIGPPIGVDLNSLLQISETGADADGQAIVSSARTGWFKLSEGLMIMSVERIIPDFILAGEPEITLSIYTADYPTDTPVLIAKLSASSTVPYIIFRARARLCAIQIDCTSPAATSSFWRLGSPLLLAYPAGKRQ